MKIYSLLLLLSFFLIGCNQETINEAAQSFSDSEESSVPIAEDNPLSEFTDISILVNSGDQYTTNSIVNIGLVSSEASHVYITNEVGCLSGGSWQTFETNKSFELYYLNQTSSVFVKFKDINGTESNCISDSIIHDDTPPSNTSFSINSGDIYTQDSSITLSLNASDATEMYITNDSSCNTGGTWEAFTISKSTIIQSTNSLNNLYVKFRDLAGNESSCLHDSIIHDSLPPANIAFSINSNATITNTQNVTLDLSAAGASHMYITDESDCATGGVYETYLNSKTWTLAQTNTTANVYVKFKDAAGNESVCIGDSIIHDDISPAASFIKINSDYEYTTSINVTLNLSAVDANEMYVTNTVGCSSGGVYESYNSSKAWTLGSLNSNSNVYVKFKDTAGNESSCISDSIIHDNTPPSSTSIVINSGASSTSDTSINLTLNAINAAEMYITNEADCNSGGSYESYATSKSWIISELSGNKNVYVKFKDSHGNESSCISDSIIFDNAIPSGASISINSDKEATNLLSANLSLTANNTTEMYITNTPNCTSGGTWESFKSEKDWTIDHSMGIATVYVKFRNDLGSESSCISDSIIYDITPPSLSTFKINNGATHTNSNDLIIDINSNDAHEVCLLQSSNINNCTWIRLESPFYETAVIPSSYINNAEYEVKIFAWLKDTAGNISSIYQESIIWDNKPPVLDFFNVYGSDTLISIQVSSLDYQNNSTQMYVTFDSSCSTGSHWEPYGDKELFAPLNYGTQTIYLKSKDAAGNESDCLSRSFNLSGKYYRIFNQNYTSLFHGMTPPIALQDFPNYGFDQCESVVSDSAGNIYCGGWTYGNLGETNGGGGDIFITKLDNYSNISWIQQFGAETAPQGQGLSYSGGDSCKQLLINNNNELICISATGGSFAEEKGGSSDALLIKVSSDGSPIWSKQLGNITKAQGGNNQEQELVTGGTIDNENNIYVIGRTSGHMADINLNTGRTDIFIAKFSTTGNLLWIKQFGQNDSTHWDTSFTDRCSAIDFHDDFLYATCYSENNDPYNSENFIVKLDLNANIIWKTIIPAECNDIKVDNSGNIVCGGEIRNNSNSYVDDTYLTKLDTNGNILWSKQIGNSNGNQECLSIEIDSDNNILCGGATSNYFGEAFGGGDTDAFVYKADPQGQILWIRQLGQVSGNDNSKNQWCYSVTINKFDNSVICAGQKNGDAFVIKLDPNNGSIY